jgi:hypothetical protein
VPHELARDDVELARLGRLGEERVGRWGRGHSGQRDDGRRRLEVAVEVGRGDAADPVPA